MYDVFTLKDFSFPKDFFWGSGYAGHQVEGDNTNNNMLTLQKLSAMRRSEHQLNGAELNRTRGNLTKRR